MDNTQITLRAEDLGKMYGNLLIDTAKMEKQHHEEMEVLKKQLDSTKKILLSIIAGLTIIILALIIGATIVFSSITLEINIGETSGTYGDITLSDEASLDNSSSNVEGDQTNNFFEGNDNNGYN
jgi:hypothetical protein